MSGDSRRFSSGNYHYFSSTLRHNVSEFENGRFRLFPNPQREKLEDGSQKMIGTKKYNMETNHNTNFFDKSKL
jgi:hypothetical protein